MNSKPIPTIVNPLFGAETENDPHGNALLASREVYAQCRRLVPLGFWLDLCEAAGVPHIPAKWSPPFPTEELYACLDGDPCPTLDAALDWAKAEIAARVATGEKVMFRWECCASGDLKYHLAEGRGYGGSGWLDGRPMNPFTFICVDDPRLLDLTVGETTRCCVRPYVAPHIIAGYPLEIRVFYGPAGFQGASSYYPQRPLPENNFYVGRAFQIAQKYAAWLFASAAFPVGFSADFLVGAKEGNGENDEVLFLEGGPPHHDGGGAHPCAFAPGKISGIALAPQEGALTA